MGSIIASMMVCSCININELDIHIYERWRTLTVFTTRLVGLSTIIALRLTRVANSNEYKEKRKTSLILIPFFSLALSEGYTISCRKGEFKYLHLLVCKILLQVTRSPSCTNN